VLPCPVMSLYCIGSQAYDKKTAPFLPTSAFKGFLTSKVRLVPFLSELGALSAREDKRLAERADDVLSTQMLGKFSSRFSQLAKRAECLA